MTVRHPKRFRRLKRFKDLMMARKLRLNKPDFRRARPVAAIIGEYISDRIRVQGIYERDLLEVLRDCVLIHTDCRGMAAVDVGANIGNHTLFFADLFAEVFAFEPNPLTRRLLQINLDMNGIRNVQVQPFALADHSGRALLAFKKANLGAASTCGTDPESDETAEVELVSGDDVISPSKPIGLIKVDVEGAEDGVLRGLEKTIGAHRPILIIEQLEKVIDEESGTSPSFLFLKRLGYTAIDLRPRPSMKSKLGVLAAMVLGRTTYHLQPIARLEKRDYSGLVFVPSEERTPLTAL